LRNREEIKKARRDWKEKERKEKWWYLRRKKERKEIN
jgi:hypothetical protein